MHEQVGGRRARHSDVDQEGAMKRKEGLVRRIRLIPKTVTGFAAVLAVIAAASLGGAGAASGGKRDAGNVVFLSNQLAQVSEISAMRDTILKGFNGNVDYVTPPVGQGQVWFNRIQAEAQAGKGTVSLLGGLHGDYLTVQQYLTDLTPVAKQLTKAGIPKDLMALGKLGTKKQYYIPWMQATYIMVANKQALQYLPKGAKINALTYAQLRQWAKNMKDKTGQARFGMPAGSNGLINRFLQGYLLPSFSGGVVTTFKSQGAINGWLYMQSLWKYTHPQSLTYNFMQDPLLSGEVWVAWDHVARLTNALKLRGKDFVAFPAPRGPKGRGYMPVLAGLAIPKTAPNAAGAKQLIKFMESTGVQARTLGSVGFFPVVGSRLSARMGAGLLSMSAAVSRTQRSKDALKSLLPIGLGAESGNFSKIYVDTFTRIVVKGENPRAVVNDEAQQLQAIMDKTGAPCWAPDPPSKGPCKVK
jgi:multiple sugar transport system substrate-binding protein